MNKSIIMVVLGVFVAFFSICIKYASDYSDYKEAAPTQNDVKLAVPSQEQLLLDEEKTIWDEVTTATKLSYTQYLTLKETWHNDYKHGEEQLHKQETASKPLSKETYNLVISVLQDFNYSTQQLPLLPWKINSLAAATDTKLFINERLLHKLPKEAQKFVIAHEIQHVIHKDTSTRYVIDRFYDTEHKKLSQNHPIYKLHRFFELRADIGAASKSPEYAQGYKIYAEMLAKKGINAGITHPKHSVRLATAQKILQGNVAVAA